MISICTVSDKDYLFKGLAMRQSLIELGVEFDLYWLCVDYVTYNHLVDRNLKGTIPILLSELELSDPKLDDARLNPASNYGTQYSQYVWTLTPYFVNYVLHRFIRPDQFLFYVDADIFFLQHPSVILEVVGDKSFGVHTHRFGVNRRKIDTGWFNVGVTVFRKNSVGMVISDLWKSWLLDWNNPYREEYGTCGDQKYIELLVDLFGSQTCIFDKDERISHLAPWCTEIQGPVVFFHFSHFTYDQNKWSDSLKGEWNPSRFEHIKPYYENYYDKILQVAKL